MVELFSVDMVVCPCRRKLVIMLLLNKREEMMAVRGGGGHLYKNTFYLHTEKHRKIGREHRENTGNLILT